MHWTLALLTVNVNRIKAIIGFWEWCVCLIFFILFYVLIFMEVLIDGAFVSSIVEGGTILAGFLMRRHPTFKDVRAHCYCASLVRTLYMTWRVLCHVFQVRALSRNSTKYRADDLSGSLICEYFCLMLGAPHFFFRQITSFSDSFHYTKKQKKSVRRKF